MPCKRKSSQLRKMGLAALTISAFALYGCGHVPVRSIPALAAIDFQTTQFQDLRAAVELPEGLVPQEGGVRLNLSLTIEGLIVEERSYALLQSTTEQTTEAHNLDPEEGRHAFIYRLNENDQLGMDTIRQTIEDARQAGQRGSLSMRVSVDDLCARGPLHDDQLLIDVFLKTSETDRFVRTLDSYDLRELMAVDATLQDALRPCGTS